MKKVLFFSSIGFVFLSSTAFVIINSNGIAGRTGSPGEVTCNGCHGGGGGTTSVNISASPAFTSNQYIPGQTYTISIDVANASFSKFAFGCEILNSSNTNAGTMANAGTGVAFANSGSRKNAIHTTPKAGSGSASFTFEWTAPASGNATFYVAGNAVNGNGNTGGDTPANTSLVLSPLATGIEQVTNNSFHLSIFPNPVIESLNVQYYLSKEGLVDVTIYSLDGKELETLYNGRQTSGPNSLNLKTSEKLEAGIYFIKMAIDGKTSAQKLFVKKTN